MATRRTACFAIVVPFAPAPVERHKEKDGDGTEVVAAAGGAAAPAAREEPVDLAELEGLEVLVAEDNQLNMELLTEVLAMSKVAATRAWNGKEAMNLFARSEPGHFDLILMDMQMPEMNGCEAARAIRSLKRPHSHSPIVAVTANAFAEDMMASMQAGMNAHISRPIDFKVLQTLMVRLKRGRKSPDKPWGLMMEQAGDRQRRNIFLAWAAARRSAGRTPCPQKREKALRLRECSLARAPFACLPSGLSHPSFSIRAFAAGEAVCGAAGQT